MISVFPNPTRGEVFVQFELDQPRDLNVRVVSLLGQELRSTAVSQAHRDRISFNLEDLADGVYLIEVRTDDGRLVKRINLMR
ncbi:MAG: T9SS type A sorting domain-containing protein [Bacteroidia bacterium]|nr:T9SS type A sorting domain-containing protein [Bacteroidia bacterium]